jgi:hypothetical protein
MKTPRMFFYNLSTKVISFLFGFSIFINGCMPVGIDCPSAIDVNNRTGHNCAFYANDVFMDSVKVNENRRIELPIEDYDKTCTFKMIYQEEYDSIPHIYSITMRLIPCDVESWTVKN